MNAPPTIDEIVPVSIASCAEGYIVGREAVLVIDLWRVSPDWMDDDDLR